MNKMDERLFITDEELLADAQNISIELNQIWETLPFYLDEDKPLHGTNVPHDPELFKQFIRIPQNLLPSELQGDAINHPPKRFQIQVPSMSNGTNLIDKKETNKLIAEEHLGEVFDEEDDEGDDDYDANKFEDYDQEDMSEEGHSED
ncbi:Hypothetical protein EHI5A_136320 [Entamoeba histolytica KU27]|nr:Hypothetical protein EHI5A_136320 [Entamoeba histolytica KU27]